MKKSDVAKQVDFLRSYAGKKTVKNFGGNFWGFNRSRCTIIKPEMIDALREAGHIEMASPREFKMNKETE